MSTKSDFSDYLWEKKKPHQTKITGNVKHFPSNYVIDLENVFSCKDKSKFALAKKNLGKKPELTKIFEEVRRGTLDSLAAAYATEGSPKGEITIVIGPPDTKEHITVKNVDELLSQTLKLKSVRDATIEVTQVTGWPKRKVYTRALALQNKSHAPD